MSWCAGITKTRCRFRLQRFPEFRFRGEFKVSEDPEEFEAFDDSIESEMAQDSSAMGDDDPLRQFVSEASQERDRRKAANALPSKPAVLSAEGLMITRQSDFDRYCDHLSRCETIAFDTEFVSEDCHRPDLCLIQVATAGGMAVIDPKMLDNVERFWEIIVEGDHETVVHAGREEMRFCLFSTQKLPKRFFDVQLAAGFIGLEYPGAYRTLVQRLMHRELAKEETRTNWRHRPLNDAQVAYALLDVEYLIPMRERLGEKLEELGRDEWCREETQAWAESVRRAETHEPWRRVGGTANLDSKCLAIVRELWLWREEIAIRRNCPARRVLRDDLIIELAKRGSSNVQRIKNVRGLERADLKRHLDDVALRIQDVLAMNKADWPEAQKQNSIGPPLNLLVQFLQTALGCLCRDQQIAPSIVATSQDLREFVAYRLGITTSLQEEEVALLQGWRKELVCEPLEKLLSGQWSIGVEDPVADQPLRLVGPGADGQLKSLPPTARKKSHPRRSAVRRRRKRDE